MIHIEWLHDTVLVVEHPTGVLNSGQVGGMSCLHPEVEGFVVLLGKDFDEWGMQTCAMACHGGHIEPKDVAVLQESMPPFTGYDLTIDLERLDKSTECFVPVICTKRKILPEWSSDKQPLHGKKAWIMCSSNCD